MAPAWQETETGAPPKFVAPTPHPASQQVAQAAAAAQLAEPARPASRMAAQRVPSAAAPPALDAVKACWTTVSDAVRRAGRGMVAESLKHVTPAEVTPSGGVILSYAATDDTFAKAVESARADVLAAVQGCIEGVTSITLRVHGAAAEKQQQRTMQRLTQQEVTKQRTEQLMTRDPLLDAAVRALDLELLD